MTREYHTRFRDFILHRHELEAIHGTGNAGQIVVLGYVSYSDDSTSPLRIYERPATFKIVEVREHLGHAVYYILEDRQGIPITADPGDSSYLYDAQEWIQCRDAYLNYVIKQLTRQLTSKDHDIELLKELLTTREVSRIVVTADELRTITKWEEDE